MLMEFQKKEGHESRRHGKINPDHDPDRHAAHGQIEKKIDKEDILKKKSGS
jgi:hypothetical protein